MKPNFALILSSDGIGLVHRASAGWAGAGWNMLGEVSLAGNDLGAKLASLRDKAAKFEPAGLHCALVLPNDQIKYISLPRADILEDDPQQTALEALAGATPYAVDALVVDWSLSKDQLQIAAVARETLTEAENFVTGHGFGPVCFVAAPGDGDFTGAPYFGVTSSHDAGDPVERDMAPVRITGSAFMPEPRQPGRAATPEQKPKTEPEQLNTPPDDTAKTDAADTPTADTPQDEAPDNATEAAEATFASIRAHRDNLPTAVPKLAGAARFFASEDANSPPVGSTLNNSNAPSEPYFADVTDAALPSEPVPEPDAPQPPLTAQSDVPSAKSPGFSSARPRPPTHIKPVGPKPESSPESSLESSPESSPVPALSPSREKARMTVFGSRDRRQAEDRPGRSWLVLAALVVASMISLAILASLTFEDGLAGLFHGSDRAQIAAVSEPDGPPQTDTQSENITDLTAANSTAVTPATAPPISATDNAADNATGDAIIASLQPADDVPQVAPEAVLPAQEALILPESVELTPDQARARYAATGIWQMAPAGPQPPKAANLENLYQTSIDSAVTRHDAIALPDLPATATDTRPLSLLSPPKAGTQFSRDPRGLVIATKAGALTPEGIRVYAGQPALVPPARPAAPAQPATERQAIDLARLQKIRPRPRPDDLAEQHERTALGGRTLLELAGLRPKLRPQSAQEAATEAASARADSANAIDVAVTETAQSDLSAEISALIITASLRPTPRPEGFSETVARIRATMQPQGTPDQPLDASAVAAITPTIPTSASIASAATDTNTIKLRKINLIGVYGTPNSRRALVRLANGRYRKVVIGDKLDGGKVAAIGDTELRYIKRGRSVVLKLPKG